MKLLAILIVLSTCVFAQTITPSQPPTAQDLINAKALLATDLETVQKGGSDLVLTLVKMYQDAVNVDEIARSINDQNTALIMKTIDDNKTTMNNQLDLVKGSMTEVVAEAHKAETEAEAAQNSIAAITLLASNFIAMFPCAIITETVTVNELGQRVLTVQTPTANCTAWAEYSPQTGLQANRQSFSGVGTMTQNFDSTKASTFTFVFPPGLPDHGTMLAFTYDVGGTKQFRQIEF